MLLRSLDSREAAINFSTMISWSIRVCIYTCIVEVERLQLLLYCSKWMIMHVLSLELINSIFELTLRATWSGRARLVQPGGTSTASVLRSVCHNAWGLLSLVYVNYQTRTSALHFRSKRRSFSICLKPNGSSQFYQPGKKQCQHALSYSIYVILKCVPQKITKDLMQDFGKKLWGHNCTKTR